jgi:antitoxin VapB
MGIVQSKTFKSGNSIAVRLPREVALAEGISVTIEKRGGALIIRPTIDPVEERRKVTDLVAELRRIGPVGEIEQRDSDIFPDRPGLY